MTGNNRKFQNAAALTVAFFLLAGCLTDEEVAQSAFVVDVTNSAPSISGTAPLEVTAGNAYRFTPTVSDPDGDPLTFSISGLPRWASFNAATGELSGTPQPGDAGTYSNIFVTVSDGTDSDSVGPFAIVVIDDGGANSAPSISGTAPSQVTAGSDYRFAPTASDSDGDALTFSISGLPQWASFNASTGALSGTPQSGDVGTYSNIAITVTDGTDSASLASFAITVVDNAVANSAPSISGTAASQVTVGDDYGFTPTASDADGDALTFSISGLPRWASFDASTGELRGTPQSGDVGSYSNIVITVTDGTDSASLASFAITVVDIVVNSPPSISGTAASQVTVGDDYGFTPTASDSDGDTLTFSISGLPRWASFDASTGELSGTPQSGDVGTYSNIVITVTDGTDSSSLASFTITVNAVANSSVTLSWTAPTENEDGSVLTDLDGYTIYWGTTPGNYPDSVTIDNASITTYVVENISPGTYEFVATSFNQSGVESRYSSPVTKVVQ